MEKNELGGHENSTTPGARLGYARGFSKRLTGGLTSTPMVSGWSLHAGITFKKGRRGEGEGHLLCYGV